MRARFMLFALGAATSWAITYYVLTYERRTVSEIKSEIEILAGYHDLTERQHQRTMTRWATPPLASDEKIVGIYRSVIQMRENKLTGKSLKRFRATVLAAEII